MKRVIMLYMAVFIVATVNNNAGAQTAAKSIPKQQKSATGRPMAKEGEKVWVIINHVKADKRQQFEKFIHEVFWPMATKLSPQEQRVFRQTQVLHPTAAEADGTYSYIFIMDPLIEGADYEIEHLLENMYGKEKAAEYGKLFGESLAREQTQIMTVQSRY